MWVAFFFVLLVCCACVAGQEGEMIVSRHKAVFNRPPEKTPANCAVDGPLLGNGDTLAALSGNSGKISFHIGKNDLWIMKAEGKSRPQPLAQIDLCFAEMTGASYRVEQDLFAAVTTGCFENGEISLALETGVMATENLIWIKIEARKGIIKGTARMALSGSVQTNLFEESGLQVVERRFEKDVMIPAGAACALRNFAGKDAFMLEPGKPVVLVAAVCSVFDDRNFRAVAVERARGLNAERLAELRKAHEGWWRKFWNESFIEIPDKVLEQRYYLSNYLMASASRVCDFPPGLFGWVTTDNPAWFGDYHMNYNHVAPFYGLYAANHIGQADPCHGPILASLEQARALCRKSLGIPGLLQVVGIGPKGSLADIALHGQKSNSSYSCVPLAFRWYATYDLEFGRQAYPFVRETAAFWENWLKFEPFNPAQGKDGRYVIHNDAVHEGSGDNVNSILSLGLIRMVMNLALDMSKELGLDADRREKWMHIRDHLSDYPKCTVRDLPEKNWPRHMPKNDATLDLSLFRFTEKGTPWWSDNTVGIQHIYPAGGIGLDSSAELLERSRNQVRVLNRWADFNGRNSIYAAAARVGCDPRIILKEMAAMLEKTGLPNGMIKGNPHGMEQQSIVPNALQEMLMQSHEGVLRFFPCWPREMDARFGTLRARGAFLVSAELKSGMVANVQIVSEKGRDCMVQNPWPCNEVAVMRNGRKAETVAGERFSLKTSSGENIGLVPIQPQ